MKSPYVEAQKFDDMLNSLAEKYPLSEENAQKWLLFLRTIKSSLVILETEVFNIIERTREHRKTLPLDSGV